MLLLALLKAKALHGQRLTTIPTVPAGATRAPNEAETLLLSRVFSLLQARTRQRPWEGPIDLDLMAFNASVRVLTHASL